jgi:hypothetical protein
MLRHSILGLAFLAAACSAGDPSGNDRAPIAANTHDFASTGTALAARSADDERVARVRKMLFEAAAELCRRAAQAGAAPPPGDAASGAACAMPVVVNPSGNVFASTNGERVRISKGFVGFTETDDELAFVLAHEMAHVLLRHRVSLGDGERRNQEHEADTLGLYIAIRAGYDGRTALGVLPRLASFLRNDAGDSRYPGFAERHQRLIAQVARMNGLAAAAKATRRQLAAGEIVARVVSDAAP